MNHDPRIKQLIEGLITIAQKLLVDIDIATNNTKEGGITEILKNLQHYVKLVTQLDKFYEIYGKNTEELSKDDELIIQQFLKNYNLKINDSQ